MFNFYMQKSDTPVVFFHSMFKCSEFSQHNSPWLRTHWLGCEK